MFMLVLGCLFGCSEDGSEITDLIPKVPIVTIEKLRSEKVVDEDLEDHIEFVGEEVRWRLNANPPPKTDLVVKIETSRGKKYIVIPKHQKISEEFSNITVFGFKYLTKREFNSNDRQRLLEDAGEDRIGIAPLPTISIVGEGTVVDVEELHLPEESLGEHIIPEDFDFPLYEIGDPSEIFLSRVYKVDFSPPLAYFVFARPPSGSEIAIDSVITLEFDEEPTDLTVSVGTVTLRGKEIEVRGPFPLGHFTLLIKWRDGSQGLRYIVR